MNITDPDLHPLGDGGRFNLVAATKLGARILAVAIPVLLGALSAYSKATSDATSDADTGAAIRVKVAKDSAEAGYQFTSKAFEALQHRVLVLEQAAARQALVRKPVVHGHRPTLSPSPVPVSVAVRLPSNLDEAARQITRGTPPAPPPTSSDAGQPPR